MDRMGDMNKHLGALGSAARVEEQEKQQEATFWTRERLRGRKRVQ